jgi:DNA-binding NarL/FixJ family response regulator
MDKPLLPHLQHVFEQLITGKTNPEIAAELGLKLSTVKSYSEEIYETLQVSGREELMRRYSAEENVSIPKRDFGCLDHEDLRLMELLTQGLTNAAIGRGLYKSEDAIKKRLHSLTQEFNLHRKALAAAYIIWKKKQV